jgi:hypothetical protein
MDGRAGPAWYDRLGQCVHTGVSSKSVDHQGQRQARVGWLAPPTQ